MYTIQDILSLSGIGHPVQRAPQSQYRSGISMAQSQSDQSKQRLQQVDIERHMYGRRYSGLPVDTLERSGFTIDCRDSYMQPEMYDIQQGDTVRWLRNGRYVQGVISQIERNNGVLQVALDDVELLPPDFFPH